MGKQNDRYKWIIFAAALFVALLVFGVLFAFASLLNELLDTFGENRSRTVTVHSLFIGVSLCTGILSGILVSRFGVWKVAVTGATLCSLGMTSAFFAQSISHLYVCIGCITGFGTSLLFISSTTALSMSFLGRQRLLVLAINQSTIGVAQIVLPYIFNYLVDMHGLKGTFLLLGGMYLNCIPMARLFVIFETENMKLELPLDNTGHINPDNDDSYSSNSFCGTLKLELSTLKDNVIRVMSAPYILHLLAVGVSVSSINAYISLVLDILQWKGFSESEALAAFPVVYGVGVGACLLPGLVKQCTGVNSLALPIVFGLCGCIGQVVIYASSNHFVVMVGCGLCGITVAGLVSAAGIVVVQIAGQDNIAVGYGLVLTTIGILSAALGPTYGVIRDYSGSYGTVLITTSGLQMLGTFLLILTSVARKKTGGARL